MVDVDKNLNLILEESFDATIFTFIKTLRTIFLWGARYLEIVKNGKTSFLVMHLKLLTFRKCMKESRDKGMIAQNACTRLR